MASQSGFSGLSPVYLIACKSIPADLKTDSPLFLNNGMEKLEGLSGVEVNVDDPQEADEFDGDVYYF